MEYNDYDDYLEYAKNYQGTTYNDFHRMRDLMVREYDLVYFLPNPFILSDDVVIE